MKATRSKYGNKRTAVGSDIFDSKKEAARFIVLCDLVRKKEISGLKRQVKFDIHSSNNKRLFTYVADFVYQRNGETIVEDVKSPATRLDRVYRIKKKAMKLVFDIDIHEV
jgi:hypothetical protein